MPRKKRRKSRKKRRRSRRGGFLEIFKPQCWTNSPGVMAGRRRPSNDAEHKCCCGTNLGVTEWGGAPACKNKYEEECKKFSLTRPVNDMLETRKQKGVHIATEKEKEKGKKVRKYHMTRKLHPKLGALRKKNANLYGQPCKSKFTGQLYEEVKPEYGTKISMGGPGVPCVERRGVDCSKPENNPSGIPIQHHTNWLASVEAFKQPQSEFQPGVVDKDGLVCRPDWGEDLWGHPINIQKKLEGKGEWCRLDPVESGWKSNKSKSNKQTCLGAANKNLFASALSARDKGRYYKGGAPDRQGMKDALENVWKQDYYHPSNVMKRTIKREKKEAEEKKQRITTEVQKQATAFAKKQAGNNAEFFNAEEGNVFHNAISNGGRRRSRRKTRKKRGGAPFGNFIRGDTVQLTEAGLDYYTALTDRAQWLFGGRPQPDRETAATWRGRINDSKASGWDSDNENSKGYVQVQWPRNTISYPSGVGRMIGYGVDRPFGAQPHLQPPINYIKLARRKPPKSAMKKHTTRKKKHTTHPPYTPKKGIYLPLTLLGGKRRKRIKNAVGGGKGGEEAAEELVEGLIFE